MYSLYKQKMQVIADLKYAAAVLQWDQETYMPPKGATARGRQIATLTELAHSTFTKDDIGDLLAKLSTDNTLTIEEKRNVDLSLHDYKRSKKLPSAFVRTTSEAVTNSFHAWVDARKQNDFKIFEPHLAEVVALKRREADYLGFAAHPYDALMDEYDRGLTVEVVDGLFGSLLPQIKKIVDDITEKQTQDIDFLRQHFDKEKQWQYGLQMLRDMHFDFESGRQDLSEHPFTTNFSTEDVRVTTRVDENDFSNMLWSCIHEGGHALYEQGLPAGEYGLPLGEYCSLSIHESQSRLWENCIGRSEAFWSHHFPQLKAVFPTQLKDISTNEFYRAINKVQPSFIRTEADELTYHLHVMIRYEIEKNLIEGTIATSDVRECWNDLYKKHLDIDVPDDRRGCLQDVHWSHGSFGYFPTYSIGSLYAAQMWAAIQKENKNVLSDIGSGNTAGVWGWLQKNVYAFGRYYSSAELCKNATGSVLNEDFFVQYAKEKYENMYRS